MAKKKAKVQQPKRKKLIQRLVRRERVAQKENEGWKIVPTKKGRFRDEHVDVILMEKAI